MSENNNANGPTDLFVPFEEKDAAKKLGARWNVQKKLWFVPEGLDLAPFKKWLPPELKANGQYDDKITIRSKSFWIVENTESRKCWKCTQTTPVYAFFLPASHKILNDVKGNGNDVWEVAGIRRFLSLVSCLNETALRAMRKHTSDYKLAYHHGYYWLNHCKQCGALLSDWYDHFEPDGAFAGGIEDVATNSRLFCYDELFEGNTNGGR